MAPHGRFGDAHVAWVPEQRLLDKSSYEYWTGTGWQRGPCTIVVRLAPQPTGLWGAPITVAMSQVCPHLYGGFVNPDSKGPVNTVNDGPAP